MEGRPIEWSFRKNDDLRRRFATQSSQQCARFEQPLLSLEKHAFSLHSILDEPSFGTALPTSCDTADWLILAAGLQGVLVVTNGLHDGDDYCSNVFEEDRGDASSLVATELTRTLFVWGATEKVMAYALKESPKSDGRGRPRRFSKYVGSRSLILPHHECVATSLVKRLENHTSERFVDAAIRARRVDSSIISQGTLAAYQVRNILAHGSVNWPESYDHLARASVLIGRLACRVLLFAIQSCMIELVSPTASIVTWSEESGRYESRRIADLIPQAHLDAVDSQ